MIKTVNRVLLGLLGLGLFALGGGVLLGGLDLQRRWGFDVPGWWPFRGPADVVLGDEGRLRWRAEGWWWPTVITVLAALLVLLLWWLWTLLRKDRLHQVLVDSQDGTAARLDGRALEDVIEKDAQALDGVARARVRLRGRRTAPVARMRVWLEPHAEPEWILDRLDRDTLARARDSAGLDRLPTEARLREVRHRAHRVD
ncbi:alkaline shock response membrane anchor protein AmaP [Streptomyces sp. NPDC058664]|uniref:alkaline shock response membrane anchor protein AmaP n=1 Tax=unclassified Streptomyces TaxID=2593676 RepID=UPI003663C391